jgi:hypothetical protein
MAAELHADAATQYEAQLTMALPPEDSEDSGGDAAEATVSEAAPLAAGEDSAEGPGGTKPVTDGEAPATEPADEVLETTPPSADAASGAEDESGQSALPDTTAPEESSELPGEPEPEPEVAPEPDPEPDVVDSEAEEISPERLVELAEQTLIPLGDYAGKPLGEIHRGWIEYALENTARLPGPFVEALEIFAQARYPDIWKAVRGE